MVERLRLRPSNAKFVSSTTPTAGPSLHLAAICWPDSCPETDLRCHSVDEKVKRRRKFGDKQHFRCTEKETSVTKVTQHS